MSRTKKFKLYSKLNTNILDHPKIRFDRLKKRKWLRMKNHIPRRASEFGSLLLAKQLLKAFYGNISEKQFIRLYKRGKSLRGNTGLNFIKLLERRLDTVPILMEVHRSFSVRLSRATDPDRETVVTFSPIRRSVVWRLAS